MSRQDRKIGDAAHIDKRKIAQGRTDNEAG
jgi:hypothetical protein